MNFIFCVITLSAIAIFLNLVQACTLQEPANFRNLECFSKLKDCRNRVEESFNNNVTMDEIMSLCNARPIVNTITVCLIECQMRQYEWINKDGFQSDKYMEYIKHSELGHDQTYVQAAQKVAGLCRKEEDTRIAPNYEGCGAAYSILECLQEEGNKLQKINLGYGIFYVEPSFNIYENDGGIHTYN